MCNEETLAMIAYVMSEAGEKTTQARATADKLLEAMQRLPEMITVYIAMKAEEQKRYIDTPM